MISRFTTIKGVGRFQDCLNIGGKSFTKNTIIFGQNTGGKSTLTDILWSFKTGDVAIIEGRRTFGYSGQQEIEFFDELNTSFKYPSATWNNGFINIEIFDTQFINENIFEGNEITYGHQKNLHSIIIGPRGKKLATEINSLQEEISQLTAKKTAKTAEFNRTFKREITATEFKKLPKIANPEQKIAELQSTIETSRAQDKIKGVFETIETLLISVINQNTKTILSNSIEVQAQLVSDHILKTWKSPSHSKDFLQTGLTLTKEEKENCVFCGQELSDDSKQLLATYERLFSQEYRKLQAEISTAVTKFEKWSPINFLDSIQDKLATIKLSLNLEKINKNTVRELKDSIDKEFDFKLKDIGFTVNFTDYDKLIEIFKNVKIEIDTLKSKNVLASPVDIGYLTQKIKEIELAITRHTQEWDDFLNEYDDIDTVQEVKKNAREKLRDELTAYSTNLFSTHLDTINKILQELNADFKICDFQPIRKIVGKDERIFALKFFNSHRVSIDETSIDKPNFKNTLSESDKRVLAFAFFYSLTIHDPKLQEKIIVFDDPFSSFDSDRRTKTAELLANPYLITKEGEYIQKTVNQLIILTHETEFFKWIFKRLDSPKALRIIPNGHNNGVKKSTLADCNVFKEFIEDQNIKNLREIQEICSSHQPIMDYEGLCAKCRVILESIFKRKYLFELEEEINQNKSVRTFIDKLKGLSVNDFDKTVKYNNFLMLCDNLNIELHDSGLKNEGGNAHTVLSDFLKLIKQV
jgi:wobble nucleotide-excising tRNase